jgi:hypothetical protein
MTLASLSSGRLAMPAAMALARGCDIPFCPADASDRSPAVPPGGPR